MTGPARIARGYLDARLPAADRLRYLRGALKQGDALVRMPSPYAGPAQWSLARSGESVLTEDVRIVLRRPFRGGRMIPAGDCLPGMEPEASQTWHWRADSARTTPGANRHAPVNEAGTPA